MNVGEFCVQFGVDADTVKVKDFVKSIGELPLKTAAAIAALAEVSLSIKQFTTEAMNAVVSFQAFENQTGLSAQKLQLWQKVGMQANISAEAMTSSLSGLQRQIADIRMGRGNVSPFQILGIDPRQDAFKIIEQLRGRVRGMDRATATNLITQMGLSPDMMNLLTLADDKFKEFSNTVVGMSPAQMRAFLNLRLELTKLNMAIHDLAFRTIGALLPVILPIIHNVLPVMAGLVEHLTWGFVQLVSAMQGFKGIVPILASGAAILMAAFAPLTAMVMGLLLILEDFAVYKRGGKSMIGKLLGTGIEDKKTPAGKANRYLHGMFSDTEGTFTGDLKTIASVFGPIAKGLKEGMEAPVAMDYLRTPGARPVNQTNTFNTVVHSTASAEDVGRAIATHQKRQMNEAASQVNVK